MNLSYKTRQTLYLALRAVSVLAPVVAVSFPQVRPDLVDQVVLIGMGLLGFAGGTVASANAKTNAIDSPHTPEMVPADQALGAANPVVQGGAIVAEDVIERLLQAARGL